MAGILDNKKRIMDTIVTQEGRRQLSSGNFKIKYASFTDGNTFYEEDLVAGSTDATIRIPFEAVNKFQDNIVFETDDSGNLLKFQGNDVELNADGSIVSLTSTYPNDTRIYNGKVVVEVKGQNSAGLDYFYYYDETTEETVYWVHGYANDSVCWQSAISDYVNNSNGDGTWDWTVDDETEDPDGYGWFLTDSTYEWPASADKVDILSTENFITSTLENNSLVTDSEGFSSAVGSITAASFDSFQQQNFITTKSESYTDKFTISPTEDLVFNYTTKSEENPSGIQFEKELNTLPAFVHDKKLSKILNFKFLPPINKNDKSPNGNFKDLNEGHTYTDFDLDRELRKHKKIELKTTRASENNNIMIQMFEENTARTKMTKLDMIDFGTIRRGENFVKIVFVGKVLKDTFDQPTFLNIFTMEIQDGE